MVSAVETVRERLLRTTAALEAARVPYAVVGGNAVAAWVATIDRRAVRNTQDVDILLRRPDLEAAIRTMQAAGFEYQNVLGVDMFLDGPDPSPRDAVHVLFANEKVKPEYFEPSPDVDESERPGGLNVIAVEALVKMKLMSNRDKDRTHLRDMLGVGLIDASWVKRFPPELGARLQYVIDTPEG
jgi:hypothetical protein